jgi:gliding motility-associated-like protein
MKLVLTTLFSCFVVLAIAQVPVINNVTPLNTYPQNKILISGSGFATNPAQMQVWFDQVKGVIDVAASSEFALTVTVPSQARLGNLEVTNLVSGLSAKTNSKFLPYFNGSSFDATSFVPAVLGTTSFSSGSVDANDVCTCDLDGDGKPDMVATRNSGSSLEQSLLLYRNTSTPGAMSFAASTINVSIATINITCADLNGDGKPELITNRGNPTRNEIYVLKNNSSVGNILFATPASPLKLFLDFGHNAFRIITRDLNADGKPEIIVSNASGVTETVNGVTTGKNPIYIYTNQSSGGNLAFSTPTKVVVNEATTTYGLDSQDLDGDGKPEIIVTQFNNPHLFILKNSSAAGVISFPTTLKISTDAIQSNLPLNHLATEDFNNDGKQDIAVTVNSSSFPRVLIYINKSTSSAIEMASPVIVSVGDSPFGLDVADIDGDKDPDIISSNLTTTGAMEVNMLLNNGSAAFTRVGVAARLSRNLKAGDLDGDNKPDIAYVSVNDHFVEVLRNKNCFVPGILNTTPLAICAGQTIRLNSIPSPSATFSWQNAANSLPPNSNSFLDVTAADTYTVTAVSEGGACSKTAAISITPGLGAVPADPTITGSSPICSSGTITLSTTDVASGYSWIGPNNFTSTLQNVTISNVSIDNAGNYTLQLSSAGGCKSNLATKRIDIANLANFVVSTSVASNQVCAGSSLTLSANFANGYSYQWIKDGADIGPLTAASPVTQSVSADGIYKVRVANIALGCNKDTAPVTVTVLTMPTSSFTPSTTTACVDKGITFTNNSLIDSRATPTYAWDFGDGTISSLQKPSKIYLAAATRTVQLTVSYTGVSGCSNSSTQSIVASNAQTLTINATVNPICSGDPSVLSVTGVFNAYSWTGPSTGTSATLNITEPGNYSLSTTEANGCESTAQFTVNTKAKVAVVVTAADQPVVEDGEILFSPGIPIQLLATGGNTFSWSPADGLDNPMIANPKATPTSELTYTVTASQVGFCNGTLSFNMKFDPEGATFYAPNAFSPNGDANNDLWVITNAAGFSDCTISIFTKHGSKVFEQKGYTNNWDGSFEGKELPQGTYYYVLNCPDKKPVTGHILLAR